jgi:hypothetical protein
VVSRGRRRKIRPQTSNNKVPEPTYGDMTKHLASSFIRAESRETRPRFLVSVTRQGHILTVTSSLFVKLPLSVQVFAHEKLPCHNALQRVYNDPDPTPPSNSSTSERKQRHTRDCAMRKLQTPPRIVCFTPFPVAMVSRTFWTLFLPDSFTNFLFGQLQGAPCGLDEAFHTQAKKLLKCNWRSARTGGSTRLP